MNDRVQKTADQALLKLSQSLSAGHSDALKAYLRTMSRFHRYSSFNAMLIWLQKPEASQVAGFRKWIEMGRCVKLGEKGIMVLAPCIYGRKPAKYEKPGEGEDRPEARSFTTAWVFDISQTEGKELPCIGKRSGDPGFYAQRLIEFAGAQRITVTTLDDLGGALGRSRGGSIELLAGLSPAETFGVLAHEVCHELLHQGANRGTKPRIVRELEAEATSFVVCEAIGLDQGSAAVDYIQLYQGDSKLLMASLSSIQRSSSLILREILGSDYRGELR